VVDVLGYLHSKGVQTKAAGVDNCHVACFFCGEDPSKRGRLYINTNPDADIPGLFHCFGGDTRLLTASGTMTLAELAGTQTTLLTAGGRWVQAPVYSFGVQRTYAVTLRRYQQTKVIRATASHRWFRVVKTSGGDRRKEVLTSELQSGDLLAAERPQSRVRNTRPSPFGVARGFVYGDGTVAHRGSVAYLHGEKDLALRPFFAGCGETYEVTATGNKRVRVTHLPRYFKTERPSLDESASYLYGWLAGYFAADGSVSKLGQPVLYSADREHLQFVRDLCTVLGVVTYGIQSSVRQGFGRNSALYRVKLGGSTLTEDFFILPEHRERWKQSATERVGLRWTVESVTEAGDEEVFCAIVPGTESFVLEDNILVGNCKLCDERGSLVSIRKHFGDATPRQEKEDNSAQRRLILQLAADFYHEALDDHPEVVRWLREERGLRPETISAYKLGYASGRPANRLFKMFRQQGFRAEDIAATGLTTFGKDSGVPVDFLQRHITIPYIVSGNVVMIRGRAFPEAADEGRKYVTGPGQKARMFDTDSTWDAEEIVICEGEFDCMILAQEGYRAVAVPGANTWQDGWNGYFSEARRVWVVFDREPNQTGRKGAEKVLEKIGQKARAVELPEHEKGKPKNDITEYIVKLGHTKADFDALLHSTHGALVTVREAIAEHSMMATLTGLKFGIDLLDYHLKPGLLPSQVMILNANTSTGKTLFLLNLFQWMCLAQPDMKVLFISLEQTRYEWWERARRIYRFFHPGATDEDAAKFWDGRIWIDDRNRVTRDQFYGLLDDWRFEVGGKPDLVAVDYLGYWAQSFKGDRYERTSDAVMAMKELAKQERLRIVSPNQVSRSTMHGSEPGIQSGRDSGVVEETSDFLFSLWRPDTMQGRSIDEHTGELKMAIGKSRHGGGGHVEHFYLAPLTLAIVHNRHVLAANARHELEYRKMGCSWEEALMRHEAGTPVTATHKEVEIAFHRKRQQQLRSR
jgi:hypothetical protein